MSEAQWTVVFAAEAINDLLLITEYLTQSYFGFGEPLAEANRHAQVRIEAIITAAEGWPPLPSAQNHTMICCLALAIWLWIVLSIGFVHALSSGKSRCWPCFWWPRSPAPNVSPPAAKPACCKTVTRSELVLFTSGSQQFTNGWMRSSSSASSALATSVS